MTTRLALVEPDGSGGLIHYAYQLADALHDAGLDVTLHTSRHYELKALPHRFAVRPEMALWPATGTHPRPGFVAAAGRKLRRSWRALRLTAAWWHLTERLVAEQPDVVLFSIIRFPYQVVFLRRLRRRGIRLAQICHEFEPREKSWMWRALNRRLSLAVYRSFDAVFLHGEMNRKAFLEAFPIDSDRTHVIRHGNEALFLGNDLGTGDLRSRYGLAADEPVVLFFGGIRPSKGVDVLIDAFAEVDRRARLLIVGEPAGVDPHDLMARVDELDLADRVTIDPTYLPLEEIGALLRTAQVVALPYRTATASGVLQVAFAFGKPVVATATGALAEDVEHGVTGLLVPPEDRASLAVALNRVLDDPDTAVAMGETARERSHAQFGWKAAAEEIARVSMGVVA